MKKAAKLSTAAKKNKARCIGSSFPVGGVRCGVLMRRKTTKKQFFSQTLVLFSTKILQFALCCKMAHIVVKKQTLTQTSVCAALFAKSVQKPQLFAKNDVLSCPQPCRQTFVLGRRCLQNQGKSAKFFSKRKLCKKRKVVCRISSASKKFRLPPH